jgi:hypothetical protein
MSLTAANRARLEKSLNTTYRFESDTDSPIYCKLGEYLEKNAVSFVKASRPKYTWEYISRKKEQLRLSAGEVEEMEDARKTVYMACFSDGGFLDIPKMVYEYFVEELGKPTNGEK